MPANRRTFLTACATTIGAFAGCLSRGAHSITGDWPRQAYDNAHTGHSPQTGPTGLLNTKWRRIRPSYGGSITSPVVGDNRLYLVYSREGRGTRRGGSWLEAFHAGTGKSLWTTRLWQANQFHDYYHSDSLVLNNDRIFVQTHGGLKMVTTDGSLRWTFQNFGSGEPLPDIIPPIVSEKLVVTGTYGTPPSKSNHPETVFGIDPADGTERWRVEFPHLHGMWQLAATKDTVYIPFLFGGETMLVALDIETGDERWRQSLPIGGVPTLTDSTLYVHLYDSRTGRHSIGAFDRTTREELWRTRTGFQRADSGFAVANGHLYSIADGRLLAHRTTTGELVWSYGGRQSRENILLQGNSVVAGETVYANGFSFYNGKRATKGRLVARDAQTGTQVGGITLGENQNTTSTPAVTKQRVFVFTDSGVLSAIGPCGISVGDYCLS